MSLFDKHRDDGTCLDPAGVGMTLMESGVWRVPMDEEARQRFIQLRANRED